MVGFTNIDQFHRRLTGYSLIAGPLLLFIGVLIQPALGPDSATALAAVAQHPDRVLAAALLFSFSVFVQVPGLIGLMRLLRGRGAVLGQIGGGLSVVGCICLAAYHTGHAFMIVMASEAFERRQMVELLDRVNEGSYAMVMVLLLMLGLGIGPLMLLAGVYRAGLAPTWAIAVAAISNVMSWTTGNELIIAASNGLFAVGFAAIGLAVLRMPDADGPVALTSATREREPVAEAQPAES